MDEETAQILKMMSSGGIELKKEKKPLLFKNQQVFDDSLSQLSEPNHLQLDVNNRHERNSCCGEDEKSDYGLDTT
jgi:hypothetical protein